MLRNITLKDQTAWRTANTHRLSCTGAWRGKVLPQGCLDKQQRHPINHIFRQGLPETGRSESHANIDNLLQPTKSEINHQKCAAPMDKVDSFSGPPPKGTSASACAKLTFRNPHINSRNSDRNRTPWTFIAVRSGRLAKKTPRPTTTMSLENARNSK